MNKDFRKFTQKLYDLKASNNLHEDADLAELTDKESRVANEKDKKPEDNKFVYVCPECGFTVPTDKKLGNDKCEGCGGKLRLVYSGNGAKFTDDKNIDKVEDDKKSDTENKATNEDFKPEDTEEGTFKYKDEDTDVEFESPVEIVAYVDPETGEVKVIDGFDLEPEDADKEAAVDEAVKLGEAVRVDKNGNIVTEGFEVKLSNKEKRQVINEAAKLGKVVKVNPHNNKLIINEGFALETEPEEDKLILESYNATKKGKKHYFPKA